MKGYWSFPSWFFNGAVFHYSGLDLAKEFLLEPLFGRRDFGAAVSLIDDRILVGAPTTDNQGAIALHREIFSEFIFQSGFE